MATPLLLIRQAQVLHPDGASRLGDMLMRAGQIEQIATNIAPFSEDI